MGTAAGERLRRKAGKKGRERQGCMGRERAAVVTEGGREGGREEEKGPMAGFGFAALLACLDGGHAATAVAVVPRWLERPPF